MPLKITIPLDIAIPTLLIALTGSSINIKRSDGLAWAIRLMRDRDSAIFSVDEWRLCAFSVLFSNVVDELSNDESDLMLLFRKRFPKSYERYKKCPLE